MSRRKGLSVKGIGTVREQHVHIEPDEHGTRAQRRLWQRLYGRRTQRVTQETEVLDDTTEADVEVPDA